MKIKLQLLILLVLCWHKGVKMTHNDLVLWALIADGDVFQSWVLALALDNVCTFDYADGPLDAPVFTICASYFTDCREVDQFLVLHIEIEFQTVSYCALSHRSSIGVGMCVDDLF